MFYDLIRTMSYMWQSARVDTTLIRSELARAGDLGAGVFFIDMASSIRGSPLPSSPNMIEVLYTNDSRQSSSYVEVLYKIVCGLRRRGCGCCCSR